MLTAAAAAAVDAVVLALHLPMYSTQTIATAKETGNHLFIDFPFFSPKFNLCQIMLLEITTFFILKQETARLVLLKI